MAADNSARAIFIRGLLLLGMMLYLIYSLGFQNHRRAKATNHSGGERQS